MNHRSNWATHWLLFCATLALWWLPAGYAIAGSATIVGRAVYLENRLPVCSTSIAGCSDQYLPSSQINTWRPIPHVSVWIVSTGLNPYTPSASYGYGLADSDGNFSIPVAWSGSAPLTFRVEIGLENKGANPAVVPLFQVVDETVNGTAASTFVNSNGEWSANNGGSANIGGISFYDRWPDPNNGVLTDRRAIPAYLSTYDYMKWARSGASSALGGETDNVFVGIPSPPAFQLWLKATIGGPLGLCCRVYGDSNVWGLDGILVTWSGARDWQTVAHEWSHLMQFRGTEYRNPPPPRLSGDYTEVIADFLASRFGRVSKTTDTAATTYPGVYYNGKLEYNGTTNPQERECGCFDVPGGPDGHARLLRYFHDLTDMHQDVSGQGGTCDSDTAQYTTGAIFSSYNRTGTNGNGAASYRDMPDIALGHKATLATNNCLPW